MNPPTALIAEDEPLLAQALHAELARAWPELQIVATVHDGLSAAQQALALKPDVLFFDIRMPGQSGLDAAAELMDAWDESAAPFPALVFVTAYDQYAVQAFEAQAIDYLLKPLQPGRLQKSVQKLRLALASQAPAAIKTKAKQPDALQAAADRLQRLLAHLDAPTPAQPPLQHLTVGAPGSDGRRVHLVPLSDVLFLQAADKYVRVVTPTGEHLLRTPLKDLLPRLDAGQFWQIHRGAVASVQRDEAGRLHLQLRGSTERLAVSRLYAHRFRPM